MSDDPDALAIWRRPTPKQQAAMLWLPATGILRERELRTGAPTRDCLSMLMHGKSVGGLVHKYGGSNYALTRVGTRVRAAGEAEARNE